MGLFADIFGGGSSSSSSYVNPAQAPFLQDLWGRGSAATTQALGQVPQYQQMGNQFLGSLGNAGQALQPFMAPGFAGQQIDSLSALLNRNLSENLLPQIGSQAQMAGGFGGGRQGIAQGVALRGTQEALASGATDIMAQDLLRRQQAAGAYSGLQAQGASAGLGYLPQQLNLGMSPLMNYAGIVGSPNVLNQQQQQFSTGVIPALGGLMGGLGGMGLEFGFGLGGMGGGGGMPYAGGMSNSAWGGALPTRSILGF